MEINGLPAHPLIVHVAVVFVPIAALLAVVYALVPRWRWSTRWPMVGASLLATAAVVYAWFSGREFKDDLVDAGAEPLRFQDHQEHADVLLWLVLVFLAVVLIAAWALGGPSGLASRGGERAKHAPVIEWTTVIMLIILAVLTIAMTIATGEAGARLIYG
ncbi:DUF2231 domain-containing protein [Nocardioides daejeonensis]|uniref:DUF2231 domain-containing protein n=1 Tax=Nocardioides daejeonensis TaxID=1046556 RepID=UPI000D743667|nr:DUF2231 domain-containing protein [Nocardioides daejeonensis]